MIVTDHVFLLSEGGQLRAISTERFESFTSRTPSAAFADRALQRISFVKALVGSNGSGPWSFLGLLAVAFRLGADGLPRTGTAVEVTVIFTAEPPLHEEPVEEVVQRAVTEWLSLRTAA